MVFKSVSNDPNFRMPGFGLTLFTILLPVLLILPAASCRGTAGPYPHIESASTPGLSGPAAALAAVQGLRVDKLKVDPNAYQAPIGAQGDPLHGWGSSAVVMSGGDNLITAAAGSISSGIARGQQRDFEEKNQQDFSTLQQAMTRETPAIVEAALLAALRPTVLGPRLDKKPTTAALHMSVTKFGLVRTGLNAAGEVLLAPQLSFGLQTTSGQVLVNGQWVEMDPASLATKPTSARVNKAAFWSFDAQDATGPTGHTLHEYVTNPALLRAEISKTTCAALRNLNSSLNSKFGAL